MAYHLTSDLLNSTSRYNLHTHTQFCDGRVPMMEMAQAAYEQGFKVIGFTPHGPIPDNVLSPVNMKQQDVASYLAEVAKVKEFFASRMEILSGMEIDYLGDGIETPGVKELDFTLSSVHFIPSPVTGEMVDVDGRPPMFLPKVDEFFEGDIEYIYNTFFDRTIAMVNHGGFDILGHLDKIASNAAAYCPGIDLTSAFRQRVNEVVDAVIAKGDIDVEINTKFANETGRYFPAPEYWNRLKDAGVKIWVNSDAHYSSKINSGRDVALQILGIL